MRAIVVEKAGGPEVLELREVPTPEVRPGWSLVRVRGFGINHSEVFTRQGLSPSVKFPRILGIECVGEVAATSDPSSLPEGTRVVSLMGEMGRAFDGGYAEYCLLPNEQIYPVTSTLPWAELAALPETYYTAFGSLQALRLEEGQHVLVRGGTSGVGVAFARLVKGAFADVRLAGTTRSAAKAEALLAAGFDEAVVDQDNVLQTDERFDRILDLVGPAALPNTLAHVGEGGVVCVTGLLGNVWSFEFEPLVQQASGSYLTCFESSNITQQRLNELVAFVEKHDIDVTPRRVFRLEEVPEAHRCLEGSHSFGELVVLNDWPDARANA